jgi:hypothetical protein
MLPRNEVALFDGAFFRKTPEAFQEELLPFPAAQPANRFTMSSQLLSPSVSHVPGLKPGLIQFVSRGTKVPRFHLKGPTYEPYKMPG